MREFKAAGTEARPTNLILVGTVHGDPQGYDRALKVLQHFRPQVVTVEISRFSMRYRRRHGPRWQRLLAQALAGLPPGAAQHLAIRRLAAQVALPFEVRAARDWSRQHGTPWRPLDAGRLARQHLPRYGAEFLSRENLLALLATGDGSLEELVAGEFRQARLAYGQAPWRLPTADGAATLRRERLLAHRLERLAPRHRRLVHLGGWEHLVPWNDGRGLWPWLAYLEPRRLLLDAADELIDAESWRPSRGDASGTFYN